MNTEKEYSYKRLFLFLSQFLLKPYWPTFVLATILAAAGTAIALYNAYALAQVINFVTAYKPTETLTPLYLILISWLASMLIRQVLGFSSRMIAIPVAEKAAKEAEVFSVEHISKLDINWQEKENSGSKLKKISRATHNIVDITRLWLLTFIDVVIGAGGALIIISHTDKPLTAALAVYLIIYFLIAHKTKKRAVKTVKEVNLAEEKISGFLYEIVTNIRTIKVLGMGSKILNYAEENIKEHYRKVTDRVFWFQLGGLLTGGWDAIGRTSLFSFVIWNIFQGNYEVGFLVLFYGYFNTVTNAISGLSSMLQELATFNNNIGRLTDILDEPVNIDKTENKVTFPENWDKIEIKNLSFKYGEKNVLSKLNLTINKGDKVGIIGLSGAGKSTLFKLLLKEYEDYTGKITIGKTSLKNIEKKSYTKEMAPVLQDTEVFNMSLKENITLANIDEENNEDLLKRAIDTAHITDFLPKLPNGLDTLVGEKGIRLSGGERQRLGIARAIFKKPQILFLDEATSHLDAESEQKIQDSLKHFFQEVTAVVIAHRLSTIKEMNKIVVIEQGKIIESGTFDELYEMNGRFRQFWEQQKI